MTGEAIDLGSGMSVVWTRWHDHERVGLIETHVTPDGDRHSGGILFDLSGVREAFPNRPVWTVERWEPLTLSPSIQCTDCGRHGWIREGRWASA